MRPDDGRPSVLPRFPEPTQGRGGAHLGRRRPGRPRVEPLVCRRPRRRRYRSRPGRLSTTQAGLAELTAFLAVIAERVGRNPQFGVNYLASALGPPRNVKGIDEWIDVPRLLAR